MSVCNAVSTSTQFDRNSGLYIVMADPRVNHTEVHYGPLRVKLRAEMPASPELQGTPLGILCTTLRNTKAFAVEALRYKPEGRGLGS